MQSLNLKVSGISTSLNDFDGLPPGALNVADNVESRYKNVLEPRRGFEGLPTSAMTGVKFIRATNFVIGGTSRVVALTDERKLRYYTGVDPWPLVPGDVSENVNAPDSVNGKCRFIQAGQNLYVTASDGIRSLASGSTSSLIRAGVPKGLNLSAVTNGAGSGFFDNNSVLTTIANTSSASIVLSNLSDITGIEVDQYVSGGSIPAGSKVVSITQSAPILVQTGNTTVGSTSVTNLASNAGLIAGVLVSGSGIATGSRIVSVSGGGPYTVVLDLPAYQTATGVTITFASAPSVTLDQAAGSTATGVSVQFYRGAQVGYRMVFGRIEMNQDGGQITRLGAASSIAICTTTAATATNVTVTGTLPKNSSNELTFVQLYRSQQTDSISITPLDQYNLVYERDLVAGDFTARTITITDDVPDSLVGIPLYSGSDQEGITQSNDPPPMAWDMCKFRDFTLFGNITRPTSLQVTIVAVGAPSGIQVNDTLTIAGTFAGVPFSRVYTAKGTETASAQEFKVFTSGTPAQNIADTADSLIRVINYDNALPVHAILISTATDLPGQILFEADQPSTDTFTVTANLHTDAYDPALTGITSDVNTIGNGVAISKSGELEAVPALNQLPVGDASSDVYRLIPLRDYVVVLKQDGIYKILGNSPSGLVVQPFDLTTKIIGADTAVSLNSAVWMLSNQGVVSISDGGVEAKSIPIDDQINRLIGTFYDNLIDTAFAVGYESDRKYILFVPLSDNPFAEAEFNFNYVTHCWTTWNRLFYTAFIHSEDGKLYVSRVDPGDAGISRERKTATYKDYIDEAVAVVIVSLDLANNQVTLDDVGSVESGDILFQDANHFSPILEVNLLTNVITIQYALSFSTGACDVLKSYYCTMTWKQVFGDNPAFVRQFSEGVALFKNTRFNVATMSFVTDYSQNQSDVELAGTGNSLWGLFPWGGVPWGGSILPSNIRFYVPQNKQLGSYLIPTLRIKQGYSNFLFQGLAIYFNSVNFEVGR